MKVSTEESSLHPSSSDDSVAPVTPTSLDSLTQVWGSIRLEKERKLAKEPPKIKSLESDISRRRPSLTPQESQHLQRKQTTLCVIVYRFNRRNG